VEALEAKLAAAADEGEQSRRSIEARCWPAWRVHVNTVEPASRIVWYLHLVSEAIGLQHDMRRRHVLQSLTEAVATADARSRELSETNSRLEAHVQVHTLQAMRPSMKALDYDTS